jgi:hypothetical protein
MINKILGEGLRPSAQIFTADLLKPAVKIDILLQGVLGDDPVFGRMSTIWLEDFFDEWKLAKAREMVRSWKKGLLLIVGTGAALVSPEPELLVYADMARWEIQSRQRQNAIGNLGADNLEESASAKYKRAFFVDWRTADQLKKELLPKIDFLIDTNGDVPKLIAGGALREGLHKIAHHPFRVVPYFDPGPWGGIGWKKYAIFQKMCRIMHGVLIVFLKRIVCFSGSERLVLRSLPSILRFSTHVNCSVRKSIPDLERSSRSASTSSTRWVEATSLFKCTQRQSTFAANSE